MGQVVGNWRDFRRVIQGLVFIVLVIPLLFCVEKDGRILRGNEHLRQGRQLQGTDYFFHRSVECGHVFGHSRLPFGVFGHEGLQTLVQTA